MAGDKDKKKKRSSKKGSKDRAKSRAKPLDAEAFDRAATTLNDATVKLMRAAERRSPPRARFLRPKTTPVFFILFLNLLPFSFLFFFSF